MVNSKLLALAAVGIQGVAAFSPSSIAQVCAFLHILHRLAGSCLKHGVRKGVHVRTSAAAMNRAALCPRRVVSGMDAARSSRDAFQDASSYCQLLFLSVRSGRC